MSENLDNAQEEIKRADHLIFVSLKYTRTCDVLKHIIDRHINCIDFLFSALLDDLKENGKIEDVPTAPIPKANVVKEQYPDDEFIPEYSDFFKRLRKISKADFSRACEFRRHVTMTVVVDEEVIKVDIDTVTDWFKRLKEFYEHIQNMLEPKKED